MDGHGGFGPSSTPCDVSIARTEAANTGVQHIQRNGRGYRNSARILASQRRLTRSVNP